LFEELAKVPFCPVIGLEKQIQEFRWYEVCTNKQELIGGVKGPAG
jgi:hypothetical protein